MLCLTRKLGQRLVVDGPAVIEVIRISDGQVRFGIVAPATTRVDREEVAKRRAEERKRVA